MATVNPRPQQQTTPPAAKPPRSRPRPNRVLVRSYPKIVVYYPTALAALLCGLLNHFVPGWQEIAAAIFIVVFFFNTVIVGLEFPRLTAFTVILLVLVLVLAAVLLNNYFNVIGPLRDLLGRIHLLANTQFYLAIAGIYLFVFGLVWLSTRFDYWEVTPNELLHHHGPFSDLERFPSPNLKLDKEIVDIFEFFLLGSGRLVMHPSSEPRAIVLENVPMVNRAERRLKYLLGVLQVRIDAAPPGQN